MLDLDFAFFNLNHSEKRGLLYRKYFLDRLTPVLFLPRLERLIVLNELNFCGCQITTPLGPGNLSLIQPEMKQVIFNHSTQLVKEYKLPFMAVDRRLKQQLLELSIGFPVIFGDNFIKALTCALIARILSRREIRRIILVGEIDNFTEFICSISTFDVPVSIQTIYPKQYEVMTYRLLYEKGHAVSTSILNPHSWNKGDLVFIFDQDKEELAVAYPHICCIGLTNNGYDLAPELEAKLSQNGLAASLYNLAPIMETCMLAEAGFLSVNEEMMSSEEAYNQDYLALQQVGDELGLWDLFLDKAI